eukprot:CAMPEP_0117889774 /NCGR_PEP_ID=MMETSP0950-20121206/22821_1 /TAXON_ID=44440 /ORGANISM="Chattonella subsalsa, Strain CCMP2191" /LENGTH=35 /DNA_ID= /DNA_START= /DNA_END= /DNA_ORIENTATION=
MTVSIQDLADPTGAYGRISQVGEAVARPFPQPAGQ